MNIDTGITSEVLTIKAETKLIEAEAQKKANQFQYIHMPSSYWQHKRRKQDHFQPE